MRLVSSNVLSFCRRSSFCLVRVLMSVQVICFSWKTARSLTWYKGEKGGEGGGLAEAGKSWAVARARAARTASWRSWTWKDGQDLNPWTAMVGKLRVGECRQGKDITWWPILHLQGSDGGVILRDP